MKNEKLKSYRSRILRQIHDLVSSSRDLFSKQEAECFPDAYDQVAYDLDRGFQFVFKSRERNLISGLHGAFSRIERGIYGKCEGCGNTIPEKRLRANPLAHLCIECKKKEEKEFPVKYFSRRCS